MLNEEPAANAGTAFAGGADSSVADVSKRPLTNELFFRKEESERPRPGGIIVLLPLLPWLAPLPSKTPMEGWRERPEGPREKEPLRVMDGCLEMAAPPKGPGREPGNTAPGGSHAEVVVVVTPLGRSAGDGTTLDVRLARPATPPFNMPTP